MSNEVACYFRHKNLRVYISYICYGVGIRYCNLNVLMFLFFFWGGVFFVISQQRLEICQGLDFSFSLLSKWIDWIITRSRAFSLTHGLASSLAPSLTHTCWTRGHTLTYTYTQRPTHSSAHQFICSFVGLLQLGFIVIHMSLSVKTLYKHYALDST